MGGTDSLICPTQEYTVVILAEGAERLTYYRRDLEGLVADAWVWPHPIRCDHSHRLTGKMTERYMINEGLTHGTTGGTIETRE